MEKDKNNTARIVVGPRSALFVPMNNIGIIILDEEHHIKIFSELLGTAR